jgi:G3E family GTPase
MTTRLILVGGFLGAGKTTLLWEASQRLASSGARVGLITNDQAPELVDTALLSRGKPSVAEVCGSCFCCNFPGLLNAMTKLQKGADAQVIIAEPVGSCTDLSATIVQPLKEKMAGELVLAPLSVLADPVRLKSIVAGGDGDLHPSAAYIYRKQLEEADVILVTKADLVSPDALASIVSLTRKTYPLASVLTVSAVSGEGIDRWLELVTTSTDAGRVITDVDYDTYAEGEAVLGWLNATFQLSSDAANWTDFARNLMVALSSRFDAISARVGHVKLLVEAGDKYVAANLTGRGPTVSIRGGQLEGSSAKVTLNARVEMSPDTLAQIVREELSKLASTGVATTELAWRCLSPGRPEPTYRYDHLVTI